MTKEEACKVLQVALTADEEIITQAYWHLARKYQAKANRDKNARERLDELNRAFVVLHPAAQPNNDSPGPAAANEPEAPSLGEVLSALSQLIGQVLSRWRDRAPEVVVLTLTIGWLGALALGAGASPLWTVLALAVAGATVWAPWRRT